MIANLQRLAAAIAGQIGLTGAILLAWAATIAIEEYRIQGLHLEVFGIELVEVKGWKTRAKISERAVELVAERAELANAKAAAAKAATETSYRQLAERIDDHAQVDIAGELARAEHFIAAGGLWAQAGGSPIGRPVAAAGDHGAGSAQGAGGTAQLDDQGRPAGDRGPDGRLVVVTADDVRICTINTVKAEAGRSLALELEEASRPTTGR